MAEEDNCTYEGLIANIANACAYATDNCGEEFEIINLFRLRYCVLPFNIFGSILFWMIAVLMTVASFYLLGKLASTYLTPVLTKVSEALKMSETLSGVTLLAFANGAPDIIASFASSGSEGGLYITIGNLFGAGLFCSTLVVARCIQVSSRRIQMEPKAWSRDLIFYILTSLILIIYGLIGYITIWMSLVFVVVYIVYLTIVLYQDRQQNDDRASLVDERHEHDKLKLEEKMAKLLHEGSSPEKLVTQSMIEEDTGKGKARRLTLTPAEVKNIYEREVELTKDEAKETGNLSIIDRILDVLTFPLRFFPMITIPNLEKEEVDKPWSPLLTISGSLISIFFISGFEFTYKLFGVNAYLLAAILGVICAGVAFLLKSKDMRIFEWILVPFALVASIMWLKGSAGTVVDIIEYISQVYGINKVLLGATFLGIGNTLADFFANSSLAALGYGVMACTGSIAGQLFNLLASIPINVINSVREKDDKWVDFDLTSLGEGMEKQNKLFAMMIMWMLVFQLIFLFYVSISTRFELNLKLAKINAVVYVTCYVLFFVSYAFIN